MGNERFRFHTIGLNDSVQKVEPDWRGPTHAGGCYGGVKVSVAGRRPVVLCLRDRNHMVV
jgi:hypothetical protein